MLPNNKWMDCRIHRSGSGLALNLVETLQKKKYRIYVSLRFSKGQLPAEPCG